MTTQRAVERAPYAYRKHIFSTGRSSLRRNRCQLWWQFTLKLANDKCFMQGHILEFENNLWGLDIVWYFGNMSQFLTIETHATNFNNVSLSHFGADEIFHVVRYLILWPEKLSRNFFTRRPPCISRVSWGSICRTPPATATRDELMTAGARTKIKWIVN
jgi:hypothetical protein